jgi:hypothetical protein
LIGDALGATAAADHGKLGSVERQALGSLSNEHDNNITYTLLEYEAGAHPPERSAARTNYVLRQQDVSRTIYPFQVSNELRDIPDGFDIVLSP